jgi:hypothetical protein
MGPGACPRFVETFRKLLEPCDCTDVHGRPGCGHAALASCFEVIVDGTDTFDAALGTIARLAESKGSPAHQVFASQAFRDMLSGEYFDGYHEESVNADRVLHGLAPRPPYEDPTLFAKASSALRPHGATRYDAARALDGRLDTAWCEGAQGDGVGEWIEVRAQHLAGWRSPLCQVLMIPGYAKSEALYQQNGRVTRLRIASCTRPTAFLEADVEPFYPNWPYPRIEIPAGALGGEADCFRVTILAVAPGRVHDTCMSEVIPHFCELK